MTKKVPVPPNMPSSKSFEDFKVTIGSENISKEERERLLNLDITKELREIGLSLEDFHGLFYQLWEMGDPRFTFAVPIAAVGFDKVGNRSDFMFNPKSWELLNLYTKSFVISHECLHVMLNHGLRIKDCPLVPLANYALDVVVNHMLVAKFGFNRASLDFGPLLEGKLDENNNQIPHKNERGEDITLCWIDTVFENQAHLVARNKPFEYYYHLLEQNVQFKETSDGTGIFLKGLGKGSGIGKSDKNDESSDGDQEEHEIGGLVLDDHEHLGDFDNEEVQEEIANNLNNSLGDDELRDLDKRMCKTEEGNAADRSGQKSDKTGGVQAGSIGGRLVYGPEARRVQKKRKWETVIKKWARRHIKEDSSADQWARINRRLVTLPRKLMIPSEASEIFKDNEKIDVFFFQDSSGSCAHLVERFFRAALSLPDDRFNVRGFCFDTRVYDVNLKKPEEAKIKGFGGTMFDILETHIQQELKAGKIARYPDAVFVVTDGQGNNVKPEKPDKWYWFLGGSWKSDRCVPKGSQTFDLDNFE